MFHANRKPQTALLVAVTMMSVIGLVASDIFLPALPTIIQRYHVTPSQGQSMLGCFLFGIAAMQLVYGPVSDSLGRRRLLIAGITLFALTSLAIPHAQHFAQVIVLRVFQAIGACAGITLGRAIIGDLYAKEEAGRIFLTIFPVVGMSPAIAPLIGGQLSNHWGWESSFLFSAAFGAVLVALIIARVPETRARTTPAAGCRADRQRLPYAAERATLLALRFDLLRRLRGLFRVYRRVSFPARSTRRGARTCRLLLHQPFRNLCQRQPAGTQADAAGAYD